MSRCATLIGRILVAGLCGLALLPATIAAQHCSNCEQCPYDPDKIYLRDNGEEIAWLYPTCESIDDCNDLIPCQGENDVDLDVLAAAIDHRSWEVVEDIIDSSGTVTFHEGRTALVVAGCRTGSIAAVLPLPSDHDIAVRLAERVRVASLRRALLAARTVGLGG